MIDLTIEEIEQALLDTKLFFPVNHKWVAEDGTKCSAWNMGNGIWTGDGGKEMFDKALEDNLKKYLVDSK
jgi:hypothetical protein